MTYLRLTVSLLSAIFICSCTEAQESASAPKASAKIIQKIAGYDVSAYGLVAEDFYIPYQKMNKNHLICLATEECDLTLLEQLLQDGADPNMSCDTDAAITNIVWCEEYSIEFTRLMLKYGADINGTDGENDSFLNYAISEDDTKLVEFLLSEGATLDVRDTNPLTSCTSIHSVESIEMLELLLQNKVDSSSRCLNGRTLLHYAARSNNGPLIKRILQLKLIDPAIADNNGETPLDYAKKAKAVEAIGILGG